MPERNVWGGHDQTRVPERNVWGDTTENVCQEGMFGMARSKCVPKWMFGNGTTRTCAGQGIFLDWCDQDVRQRIGGGCRGPIIWEAAAGKALGGRHAPQTEHPAMLDGKRCARQTTHAEILPNTDTHARERAKICTLRNATRRPQTETHARPPKRAVRPRKVRWEPRRMAGRGQLAR